MISAAQTLSLRRTAPSPKSSPFRIQERRCSMVMPSQSAGRRRSRYSRMTPTSGSSLRVLKSSWIFRASASRDAGRKRFSPPR